MTEADGWRWEFSPGTAADELGPAPQHLLETAELIKANPVRKVFRSGEFYLKLDLRTGNRLLREWRSAELLAARHIPMVEHLALGRSFRSAFGCDSSLLPVCAASDSRPSVSGYKEGKGLIRREQAGHAQHTPGKCLLKNGKLHCADPGF